MASKKTENPETWIRDETVSEYLLYYNVILIDIYVKDHIVLLYYFMTKVCTTIPSK